MGSANKRIKKAAWPRPFDGRAVVAAWAWSGPRGYVGLFWTHDTQKDEIGVYEAVTDGVGHGVWFTAPLACPVALRIVGLGQVLQDEGYGPTLSIGREGDMVADLVAEAERAVARATRSGDHPDWD